MAFLNDDEVAELLNGDISDVEELDEGPDINYETLDEILLEIPDVEVMYLYIFCDIYLFILYLNI